MNTRTKRSLVSLIAAVVSTPFFLFILSSPPTTSEITAQISGIQHLEGGTCTISTATHKFMPKLATRSGNGMELCNTLVVGKIYTISFFDHTEDLGLFEIRFVKGPLNVILSNE